MVVYGGEYWLDEDLQDQEEHADDDEAREVTAKRHAHIKAGHWSLWKRMQYVPL